MTDMSWTASNSIYSGSYIQSNGYTCAFCGLWVTGGHACVATVPTTVTTPLVPPFIQEAPMRAHDHCYCQDAPEDFRPEPHAQCCVCQSVRAKRFIPELANDNLESRIALLKELHELQGVASS